MFCGIRPPPGPSAATARATWATASYQDVNLDLPTFHRVPVTWLLEHGSESIRLRTHRELAYPGTVSPEAFAADEDAVNKSKMVQTVVKKQKDNGVWGGNLLGLAASAKDGIKDVGTIPQYRRLLQLGLPRSARPYKLADRVLFRMLSRDAPAVAF